VGFYHFGIFDVGSNHHDVDPLVFTDVKHLRDARHSQALWPAITGFAEISSKPTLGRLGDVASTRYSLVIVP
jgi:hypothetical protein